MRFSPKITDTSRLASPLPRPWRPPDYMYTPNNHPSKSLAQPRLLSPPPSSPVTTLPENPTPACISPQCLPISSPISPQSPVLRNVPLRNDLLYYRSTPYKKHFHLAYHTTVIPAVSVPNSHFPVTPEHPRCGDDDDNDDNPDDCFVDAEDCAIQAATREIPAHAETINLPENIQSEQGKLSPLKVSYAPSVVLTSPVLPAPPTTRRLPSKNHPRLISRRSLPLAIALFVAVSILICLTAELISQLNKINAAIQAQVSSSLKESSPVRDNQIRNSRRLLSIPDLESNAQPLPFWTGFRSKLKSLRRLYDFVSSYHRQPPQAFLYLSVSHLHINLTRIPMVIPKVRLSVPQFPVSATSAVYKNQNPLLKQPQLASIPQVIPVTHNISVNTIHGSHIHGIHRVPLRPPSPTPTIFIAQHAPVITVVELIPAFPTVPSSQPGSSLPQQKRISASLPKSRGNNTAGPSALHSSQTLLHDGSLNVVNGIVDVNSPTKESTAYHPNHPSSMTAHSQLSPVPGNPNPIAVSSPFPSQSNIHLSAPVQLPSLEQMPVSEKGKSSRPVDSIEVWNLPKGRQLCRIFNVGRIDDGRLLLPKWMEKHKQFIESNCGISRYSFSLMVQDGRFELDRDVIRNDFGDSYVLDLSHSDRDLFGSEAPRHHMPHYVSDIIKPLVACEVLMGSGQNLLRPLSLLKTAKDAELIRSTRPPEKLKPSVLMLPGTWKRAKTDWVRRLAHFFEHPALGFTMISSRGRKIRPLKARVFHSVLSSNVNPYEPYGLFGTTGKNILFATNGISREPPWRMASMQEMPCRISITALTRSGARKLLHLDQLEKSLKMKAAAAQMRADFRIVDFNEMSFEAQVQTMQETHVLIATHGAGNANIIFMRPGAAVIEVFPFSYKAGPFDGFAKIFGLEYKTAMSAPQTSVFKACMDEHEKSDLIRRAVFGKWDAAVKEEEKSPWIHRLEFEKEFGEPGKSQGMTTRGCVRLQQLEFNIDAVSDIAITAGKTQCYLASVSKS